MQKVQRPNQKKKSRCKPDSVHSIEGERGPNLSGNEAHDATEAWQGLPVIFWVSRGPLLD